MRGPERLHERVGQYANKAYSSPNMTPYAVICRTHGRVILTEEAYLRQMRAANRTWVCPCGDDAIFDDDHYETFLDAMENSLDED